MRCDVMWCGDVSFTDYLPLVVCIPNPQNNSTSTDNEEEEEEAAAEDDDDTTVASVLAFDLTIFNKKTNTMAMLGSGLADRHPNVAAYGPSYGHQEEFRFFGEGAEFLRAVVSY